MSTDMTAGSIAPSPSGSTTDESGSLDAGPSFNRGATDEHHGDMPAGHTYGAPAASPFPQTLDFLLDVRISVSVEVGRVQMPVRQVMELGPGAVIELQRSASEPVEIHANGKCIGRGEIVVVGEQFGVRITELGPPA
jgi:flagellar motor switch protein FliN